MNKLGKSIGHIIRKHSWNSAHYSVSDNNPYNVWMRIVNDIWDLVDIVADSVLEPIEEEIHIRRIKWHGN